ncbi:flagellin [Colwellia psychrerythraea]|uniref:Flagellin n=1 Tax=Colwellia psychrerythraea TaxID=28229 RepID=A0A099KG64_COLPS|nr:flagellin [Colwellia psychrerythraea]KGJ89764.1 flagellin domain protein [Colwellia psychrerythraea]
MLSVNKSSASLSFIEKLSQQREELAEKIASGKRINKAADDAAGFQIANRLTSQVNQNQQLSFNAQDQANINNIEAGALSAINDGLLRAQELSIQSGNPIYSGDAIQGELDQITEQINTLASDVLGQDNFISGLDASNPAATQAILEDTSTLVNDSASALGAETNALVSQVDTYQTSIINVSASRSRIEDTDFAAVTGELEKNEILLQSAIITKKNEEERKGILFNKLV